MREIKFRAWNIESKKYLEWEEMYGVVRTDDGIAVHVAIADQCYLMPEECVVEQYTGLKDSKRTKEYPEGQRIYEGDIVCSEHYGQTEVIEWMGNGYWIKNGNQGNHLPAILEVIGNIHQNPELLETS